MCPRCGATTRPSGRFCSSCGAPTTTRGAATPHVPVVTAERKIVTLLFADTVDSTRLIADVDPEVAMARLQPVLDAMTAAVHAYGGTVSKLLGDGVLALFGAPVAREDHAVRAALAALDLLATVPSGVAVRIGLHSGEVLLRSIETDLSVDYTALGPAVHLAARMERMARPGWALLTADTARMARDHVVTADLGPTAVRGIDHPVRVHRLVGRVSDHMAWTPRALGDLTPFSGRDRELAVLRAGLGRARDGRGGVTAVVGEAGVGKSRLIHEFLAGLADDTAPHRLQATPYDASTPYHPLVPLVLGVGGPHGHASVRERVAATVARAAPTAAAELVDPLIALAGGDPDTAAWNGLDPPRRRRRIRDAVRALLLAEAACGRPLLVVEDLHWIDEDTQAVLDDVVEVATDAAMYVVVTYRPVYTDPWRHRPGHRLLSLDALQGPAAEQMLDALLGTHPSVTHLRRALLAHTGGTPLFVEETVRALVESGALSGTPGDRRFIGDPAALSLPDTVQPVVAARVDRLAPADKALLQVAAVIGERIPVDVLAAIGDLARGEALAGGTRLDAAGFLRHRATDDELVFAHDLIREVVYGSIPLDRRRALHGATADALAAAADVADPQVERLAHHAYRAQRWGDAVHHLWRAAQRSEQRSAYPQAQRLLRMGLDAVAHLPDDPAARSTGIDMAGALRVAATGSGLALTSTLDHLDAAAAAAHALGDDRRRAMVEIHRSYVGSLTGRHGLAVSAAGTAQELGARLDDHYLRAEGQLAEGQARTIAGDAPAVLALLEPNVAFFRWEVGSDRRGLITTRVVTCLTFLSIAHALQGHHTEADRVRAERDTVAAEFGRPFDVAYGAWSAGVIDLLADRPVEAAARFADGLTITRSHDLRYTEALIAAFAGEAWVSLGDVDGAARALDWVIEAERAMESPLLRAWAHAHRAHLGIVLGDRQRARADAAVALAFAREHGHPWLEATALRWLAASAPEAEDAAAQLGDAIAVCDRAGLAALRRQLAGDVRPA
jgi:class 3 adenylate cyclase